MVAPDRRGARGKKQRLSLYNRLNRCLERHLPERLYGRALIIIIAPMVLLQSIIAFFFMQQHWNQVTKQLSKSVAREIALVVEAHDYYSQNGIDAAHLVKMANDTLGLGLNASKDDRLPPPASRPFFSLLDSKLSKYIRRYVNKPFRIDTLGRSGYVDIRVQADDGTIFRAIANEGRVYASNSVVFLLWMAGSSLVLLLIAVVFLRNQVRPIVELAASARAFGMGREVADLRPRGALEVREAAQAFIKMKHRIERHVEQRTAMLAGVSHDLKTILTRFKLQLACFEDSESVRELKKDADDMQHMLEDYIGFMRGDGGESTVQTDIRAMLDRVCRTTQTSDVKLSLKSDRDVFAAVKPNAFKRCLVNLVGNAVCHGDQVHIKARRDRHRLTITVDDNGPGIPEDQREAVFRPFFRLDDARNQDRTGTGLGLAVALDIVRGHGGDIRLETSPLGGLRAVVAVPV